jgi:hypothetical protein
MKTKRRDFLKAALGATLVCGLSSAPASAQMQAGEGITGRLIDGPEAPTPPNMDFDPGPLELKDSDWMGNTLGLEPTVPVPWTPLERAGSVIRCWGRSYRFDGAFPASIESAGKALLSGPVTLVASIAGKKSSLDDAAEWTSAADHRIEFAGRGSLGPLGVEAANWIEFDGMVQVKFALDAGDGVSVDRIDLEIPMPAEVAKFYCFGNGEWGGKPLGETPSDDGDAWGTTWWPFGWVGDEERGLTFVAETPRGWVEPEDGTVHALTRRGDAVIWTVRIVGRPTNLTGRTEYVFGFQATPMKPVRKDLANLVMDSGAWSAGTPYFARTDMGPNSWPKTLSSIYPDTPQGIREYKEELGVDVINMWYIPHRWVCFPEFRSPESVVKPAIAAWRAAGLTVTAYTTHYFQGYESEVFKRHADTWSHLRSNGELYCKAFNKIDPADGSNRGYVTCCPQSRSFVDYMCWGIDYLMRTYDLDGFGYIDGPGPKFCYNQAHGCGPEGEPRWPVFAVRRMAQRWWRIAKKYKPDGLLIRHSSENLFSPGLAYVDAYIVGEEFRARTRPLRELDKTRLAVTMTGLQWGAHPMWMSQCSGNPISVGNSAWVASRILPYGATSTFGWHDPTWFTAAQKAKKDFGVGTDDVAFFAPHRRPDWLKITTYRPGDEAAPDWLEIEHDPELVAGCYRRADGEVLAVLSNFGDTYCTVVMDGAPFAEGERFAVVRDAVMDARIMSAGNRFRIAIPSSTFRLLRIQPAAGRLPQETWSFDW